MVEIKLAEEKHYLNVAKLASQESEFLGFTPRKAYLDYVKSKSIYVAIEQNKYVVGYLLFGGTSKNMWSLYQISVAKPFRGQGIATLLIQELLEKAALNGAGVRLKVTNDNASAIKLYQKLGFNQVNIEKTPKRYVLVFEHKLQETT